MNDKAREMVEWLRADSCASCVFSTHPYGECGAVNECMNRKVADLIEELSEELERVKKERDAAVADMERLQGLICQVCKEYHQPDPSVRKWTCRVYGDAWPEIAEDGLIACGSFKWRGVQSDAE